MKKERKEKVYGGLYEWKGRNEGRTNYIKEGLYGGRAV
jgi:hypothetical protein